MQSSTQLLLLGSPNNCSDPSAEQALTHKFIPDCLKKPVGQVEAQIRLFVSAKVPFGQRATHVNPVVYPKSEGNEGHLGTHLRVEGSAKA